MRLGPQEELAAVAGEGCEMADDDHPIRETTGESNPFASPMSETGSPAAADGFSANRGLGWLLFSSRGRIPRRTTWAVWAGTCAVTVGLEVVAMTVAICVFHDRDPPVLVLNVLVGLLIVVFVAIIWITFAVLLKRLHDRDKPVWWLFIILVPYVGILWVLVELGCLRGTKGPNRYGPDPT